MNELSERMLQAVTFIKKNGYATSNREVANRIGVTDSTISMVLKGTRVPTWDMILDFCEAYPIEFRWIRSGKGSMVKDDRETVLLKRIEELEKEIERLKGVK